MHAMTNLASLLLADGIVTITPAEPATLELALVGLGTLATYAILSGWRSKRHTIAVTAAKDHARPATTEHQAPARRAA
jgi:hypothetical protein